jgi:hypothetical protein
MYLSPVNRVPNRLVPVAEINLIANDDVIQSQPIKKQLFKESKKRMRRFDDDNNDDDEIKIRSKS